MNSTGISTGTKRWVNQSIDRLDPADRQQLASALDIKAIQPRRSTATSARIHDVAEFFATHGRLPKPRGAEDPESALAEWVRSFRARRSSWSPGHIALAQKVVPELIATAEVRWIDTLEEFVEFCRINGRMPLQGAPRHLELEYRLGRWQHKQRSRRDQLAPHLQALAEERCPTFFTGTSQDEKWVVRLKECAAFHNQHGKPPSKRRPNATLKERQDGMWWERQRTKFKAGQLPSARIELAQAHLPELLGDLLPG